MEQVTLRSTAYTGRSAPLLEQLAPPFGLAVVWVLHLDSLAAVEAEPGLADDTLQLHLADLMEQFLALLLHVVDVQ